MALSTKQQILEIINASNNILIVANKDFNGDHLAASTALFLFLKKLDSEKKNIDISIDNFSTPEKFSFLPGINKISRSLNNSRSFVISVDISDSKIDEVSYDIKGNELNFIINTKNEPLKESDVKCRLGDFKYDLIFTIGSPDLESLGSIYDNNPEFFYKIPIVNIDFSPDNENFGQINLVDLTATSNCEIIFDLIEILGENLIDEDIATSLFAGIIYKTRGFKRRNITPKVLNIASRLMGEKARKEEVVFHLFRTKTINVLKLWGKALSRLRIDENYNIAHSLLTKQDFINTQTREEDIKEVIEEFIISIAEAKIVVILYEKEPDEISSLVEVENHHNALELTKKFLPSGSKKLARFSIKGKNLLEAEQEVIDYLKSRLETVNR